MNASSSDGPMPPPCPESLTHFQTASRNSDRSGETDSVSTANSTIQRGHTGSDDERRSLTLPLLEEATLDPCLELLDGEDSAFIAAVLFLLTAKKAAAIVEKMSLGRRVAVLQLLAGIDRISRETVDQIQRRLQRKLEFSSGIHSRPEGLHRARTLLEQLNPGVQRAIADALVARNPALANELHRHVFRFNDITRLNRRGRQESP